MLNLILNLYLVSSLLFTDPQNNTAKAKVEKPVTMAPAENLQNLYQSLGVAAQGLKFEVFEKALKGWNKLKADNALPKSGILSIVDFSQSSTAKRLYVIDMLNHKVLFNTLVAHGQGSGGEYAEKFSNTPESHQSSLGFFVTGPTYTGKHGLSLKLKGVEEGINDLAENRAIVIHGAEYVSENFIKASGRLGRSHGCPAVPAELSKPIIEEVKDGSCLFLYHPDNMYTAKSKFAAQM